MNRREFIALGSAAGWPLAARATQRADAKKRIGAMIIYAASNQTSQRAKNVFEQSLHQYGWSIGQNLAIDYRWGIADPQSGRTAAAELLGLKADLLLANSVAAARAAKQATKTVPIVFNGVSEPVGLGLVPNLSHPGGNITGFSNLEPSVAGKWVELLKIMAPQVSHAAVMFNPSSTAIAPQFVAAATAAAPKLGLTIAQTPVHSAAEIDAALQGIVLPGGALITLPDTFLGLHTKEIVTLVLRRQLPAIHPFRYFAEAGSLMSYGPDLIDQFRLAATYVDKIFRGARPGDLPVQQPTKFEFVINAKAAKALNLIVPPRLLAIANEVIE